MTIRQFLEWKKRVEAKEVKPTEEYYATAELYNFVQQRKAMLKQIKKYGGQVYNW